MNKDKIDDNLGMEETEQSELDERREKKDHFFSLCVLAGFIILAGSIVYAAGRSGGSRVNGTAAQTNTVRSATVILPARWGNLGAQMVAAGVIDKQKFEEIYATRGGLSDEMKKMLSGDDNGNIKINGDNSGIILNFLWALGLGNKNEILETGPMVDPRYGNAGNFASTGGWIIAAGDAMEHYSKHAFITLTPEQEALVERVSKNIYRPCCGNSTYFPDCNHGMAMLGLLELMASQGVSEAEMYKAALKVNSLWFPDTYRTIARYFKSKGTPWSAVDPREVLGSAYSSSQGYAQIQTLVAPEPPTQSQGGCGVDAGLPAGQAGAGQTIQPQRQPASPEFQRGEQGGCGGNLP